MSFERTAGSIKNLDGSDKITLDLMCEMLVCVVRDVREYNGVADLRDSGVADSSLLVKKAYNLMQALLPVCQTKQEGLSELSEVWQDRYKKAVSEMESIADEFADVQAEAEKTEKAEKDLQNKYTELSAARSGLLNAAEECDRLRAQIDRLNDAKLDEIAAEKDRLEADVKERQEEKARLESTKKALLEESKSLESECADLKESADALRDSISSLKKQKNAAIDESRVLKEKVEKLEKELDEYKSWTARLPEEKERLKADLSERRSHYITLLNAWNSTKSDEFVMKTLYKIPGTEEKMSSESYPDLNVVGETLSDVRKLRGWFDAVQERIDSLLRLHEEMLRCVVLQAEQITANSED